VNFSAIGLAPTNYTWKCSGTSGGAESPTCTASYSPPLPECSTTVTGPQTSPLTTGSCKTGNVLSFTSSGTSPINYTWQCNSAAQSANCSASYTPPVITNPPVCSSVIRGVLSGPISSATVGLCSVGTSTTFQTFTNGTNTSNYTWSCVSGAQTVGCNAQPANPVVKNTGDTFDYIIRVRNE
jgi:hypothetical protein